MSIFEIIMNIIFVSIPEGFSMVLICLLFIGKYDYIDKYTTRKNLKNILLVVVIPSSITSTYLLMGLNLNVYYRVFINFLIFCLLMLFLLNLRNLKKIIISSLITYSILIMTELFVILVLTYIFNFNISLLNTTPWINFAMLLPGRIFHFGVIYMFYLKKNTTLNITLFKIWNENILFRIFVLVHTFANIVMGLFIYKNFAVEGYIYTLMNYGNLAIITSIFILFTLSIIAPWILLFSLYPSEGIENQVSIEDNKHEISS